MTISRMQQPRQMYGLGSFVKSITKGVKSAVKGVTKAAKSPLGLAAMASFIPFGGKSLIQRATPFLFGKQAYPMQNVEGSPGIFGAIRNFFGGEKTLGKTLAMGALGTTAAAALQAAGLDTENPNEMPRDVESLKSYLRTGYLQLNPKAEPEEVDQFVAANTAEYATGGRVGYAMGSPEENAIQASGIMNLPLNQNKAGVTELDLRETGGFIPPVGVKEKADDIPAMLSNNEFVFTADAVRGMGGGDVNKGAQRMYDMMKKLEKGGRV